MRVAKSEWFLPVSFERPSGTPLPSQWSQWFDEESYLQVSRHTYLMSWFFTITAHTSEFPPMFKMTKMDCNVVMMICDVLEPVKTYIAFEVRSIPI